MSVHTYFTDDEGATWEVLHKDVTRDLYTCMRVRNRIFSFLNGPVRVFPGEAIWEFRRNRSVLRAV